MAKRFGRTLVTPRAASEYAVQQRFAGSDHADVAGNCERPVFVKLTGLQDGRLHRMQAIGVAIRDDPFIDWEPNQGYIWAHNGRKADVSVMEPINLPTHVDLAVRCRQCEACLKARSAMWRMRAVNEVKLAPRTWFGTLTVDPQGQFEAISRARSHLAGQGLDFDSLDAASQFTERHKQIAPMLTRYIKRVRKESGVTVRYLLVAEAHKSGAPHYHMLIHEPDNPVRHRTLQGQWKAGFSNWKLVSDERAAFYVCKYLAKSALAKVRASQRYGETCEEQARAVLELLSTRKARCTSPF